MHEALGALSECLYYFDPAGAEERMNFLANEVCGDLLIRMALGDLHWVPKEYREKIATPEFLEWTSLNFARPLPTL